MLAVIQALTLSDRGDRSGQIKVASSATGVVEKVLVKTNDKVFAGEPLIRLADDELRARMLAFQEQLRATAQAKGAALRAKLTDP